MAVLWKNVYNILGRYFYKQWENGIKNDSNVLRLFSYVQCRHNKDINFQILEKVILLIIFIFINSEIMFRKIFSSLKGNIKIIKPIFIWIMQGTLYRRFKNSPVISPPNSLAFEFWWNSFRGSFLHTQIHRSHLGSFTMHSFVFWIYLCPWTFFKIKFIWHPIFYLVNMAFSLWVHYCVFSILKL